MNTPDDEQFEAYLKRFRPIAPEPVPTLRVSHSPRHSVGIWLAAVAAMVIVVAVILEIRSTRVLVSSTASDGAVAMAHVPSEPLTMRSANAWLATAPSFKAAVDDLAFRSLTSQPAQGKLSAVAVLSKEKIRL